MTSAQNEDWILVEGFSIFDKKRFVHSATEYTHYILDNKRPVNIYVVI